MDELLAELSLLADDLDQEARELSRNGMPAEAARAMRDKLRQLAKRYRAA